MKNSSRTESLQPSYASLQASLLERWQFRVAVAVLHRLIDNAAVQIHCPELEQPVVISRGDEDYYAVRLVSHRVLWQFARNPDPAFGEAYMERRWELTTGDMGKFLTMLAAGRRQFLDSWMGRLYKMLTHFRPYRYQHDIRSSYSHVQSHYDLGNDLYASFLDPDLNYSCAFFNGEDDTLHQAQLNKLRTTLERLQVEPGMRVLDIGSGWGATCRFIAQEKQAQVTGITLANNQLEWAEQCCKGMENPPRFMLQDYREHAEVYAESYDRVVSIGMLEHVGRENLGTYFEAVRTLLRPGGRAVIHSIVAPDLEPGKQLGSPWLTRYIFPGGYIPKLEEMAGAATRAGLEPARTPCIHESFNYAETLRRWRGNFLRNYASLDTDKYDERFKRMWLYYFCMCEAMFAGHGCRVAQLILTPEGSFRPLWLIQLTQSRPSPYGRRKTNSIFPSRRCCSSGVRAR